MKLTTFIEKVRSRLNFGIALRLGSWSAIAGAGVAIIAAFYDLLRGYAVEPRAYALGLGVALVAALVQWFWQKKTTAPPPTTPMRFLILKTR